MFAATLILASYFAVPIILVTAALLRPETERRRVTVRVIVPAQRDASEGPGTMWGWR